MFVIFSIQYSNLNEIAIIYSFKYSLMNYNQTSIIGSSKYYILHTIIIIYCYNNNFVFIKDKGAGNYLVRMCAIFRLFNLLVKIKLICCINLWFFSF